MIDVMYYFTYRYMTMSYDRCNIQVSDLPSDDEDWEVHEDIIESDEEDNEGVHNRNGSDNNNNNNNNNNNTHIHDNRIEEQH